MVSHSNSLSDEFRFVSTSMVKKGYTLLLKAKLGSGFRFLSFNLKADSPVLKSATRHNKKLNNEYIYIRNFPQTGYNQFFCPHKKTMTKKYLSLRIASSIEKKKPIDLYNRNVIGAAPKAI